MFKCNKPTAVISIDSHSIKLIELKKTDKNYHLQLAVLRSEFEP
jgi:hypothetical protein